MMDFRNFRLVRWEKIEISENFETQKLVFTSVKDLKPPPNKPPPQILSSLKKNGLTSTIKDFLSKIFTWKIPL